MQWKSIPGYPGYEVTSDGQVRSVRGDLKLQSRRGGYLAFEPYVDGVKKQLYVHKAVALAFIGPANGKHVDHVNRIRTDNRLSNLRYLMKIENSQRSKSNRLTPKTVRLARILFSKKKATASELAKRCGVAIPTMCQALEGTTWANIDGPLATEHKKAKLTSVDLIDIRLRVKAGESKTSIARDYGVTRQAITNRLS